MVRQVGLEPDSGLFPCFARVRELLCGAEVTSIEITIAVVRCWFSPRYWAVCPRVSYGFDLLYEADIIAISKTGIVHEVEIKITKADLLADAKKDRWTREKNLKISQVDRYWLAVPDILAVPALARANDIGAGLFVVESGNANRLRYPNHRRTSPIKGRRDQRVKIWRLCAMRYWAKEFNLKYIG